MHTDVRSTKQSDEAFNCPHSPQSTRLRIFFKTPGGSAITDRQAPRTVLGLARVGVASAGAVPAQRPDPCRRPLRRCRMPARGSTSAVMGLYLIVSAGAAGQGSTEPPRGIRQPVHSPTAARAVACRQRRLPAVMMRVSARGARFGRPRSTSREEACRRALRYRLSGHNVPLDNPVSSSSAPFPASCVTVELFHPASSEACKLSAEQQPGLRRLHDQAPPAA